LRTPTARFVGLIRPIRQLIMVERSCRAAARGNDLPHRSTLPEWTPTGPLTRHRLHSSQSRPWGRSFTNAHILKVFQDEFRALRSDDDPQVTGRPGGIALLREMIAFIRTFSRRLVCHRRPGRRGLVVLNERGWARAPSRCREELIAVLMLFAELAVSSVTAM